MMCFHGLSYLPILLVILSVTTFVITYIIAIYEGDVAAYFPYISDTGTKPPESCIFSQLLNMAACLCVCTIFVRYKLVEALAGYEDACLRRLNIAGLILGILTALGLSLVANFQETNVEAVHLTGAFLVFGVGVVYAFIQAFLSYHMYPDFNGIFICRVRMTLSCLSLVLLIITVVASVMSRLQKNATTNKLKWKPDEPGFVPHIISTIGEWLTAIMFLVYFLTFVRDFMKLRLDIRPRLHVRHLDEDPPYPDENTRLLA